MSRVIAYIDGFNLFCGLKTGRKDHGWPNLYWLDIQALATSHLEKHHKLVAVKYFTARVGGIGDRSQEQKDRSMRQKTYIEAVQTLPLVTVIEGQMRKKEVSCRSCGEYTYKPDEKQTDVNIACEMVVDAFYHKLDTAFLFSGDTDLTAPIRVLTSLHKKVIVFFPPFRALGKSEISRVATTVFALKEKHISPYQLPDTVTKKCGYILKKPDRWK